MGKPCHRHLTVHLHWGVLSHWIETLAFPVVDTLATPVTDTLATPVTVTGLTA